VLVTAPPGVGKSRLSSEVLRRIVEDDGETGSGWRAATR
jgi:hypothetical protein